MMKSSLGRVSLGLLGRRIRNTRNAMNREAREDFEEAVEKSGKTFITGPFFMALLLAQQKMIRRLQATLKGLGEDVPDSNAVIQTKQDWGGTRERS